MGEFGVDLGSNLNDQLSGSGAVGDFALLGEALTAKNPDPVAILMAEGAFLLDAAEAVSDPIGTALAAGIGWVLDHINPLKQWLNDLTGDAGQVDGHSEEWKKVSERLKEVKLDVRRDVNHDLAGQTGVTIDAYRVYADGVVGAIEASQLAASGMAVAVSIAGAVVEIVHGVVRDAIAAILAKAATWAGEEVFSFGLATPWVAEQVETTVAAWAERLSTTIHALIKVMHELSTSVKELGRAGEEASRALEKLAGMASKLEHGTSTVASKASKAAEKQHAANAARTAERDAAKQGEKDAGEQGAHDSAGADDGDTPSTGGSDHPDEGSADGSGDDHPAEGSGDKSGDEGSGDEGDKDSGKDDDEDGPMEKIKNWGKVEGLFTGSKYIQTQEQGDEGGDGEGGE